MVNTAWAVYSKTGTLLLGPLSLASIWAGFEVPDCEDNSGDPNLGRAVGPRHPRPGRQDQGHGRQGHLLRDHLPPMTAETIGREAGVKVVTGEDALYGDALGPPGSDGDTYLKMLRRNTTTIVGNLSGA